MAVLVADTSALVSVGCTVDDDPSALHLLLDAFEVCVPRAVAEELRTLGSYTVGEIDASVKRALNRQTVL